MTGGNFHSYALWEHAFFSRNIALLDFRIAMLTPSLAAPLSVSLSRIWPWIFFFPSKSGTHCSSSWLWVSLCSFVWPIEWHRSDRASSERRPSDLMGFHLTSYALATTMTWSGPRNVRDTWGRAIPAECRENRQNPPMRGQVVAGCLSYWILGWFLYSAIIYWYLSFNTCIWPEFFFSGYLIKTPNSLFIFFFLYWRILNETRYVCRVGANPLQNAKYITQTVSLLEGLLQTTLPLWFPWLLARAEPAYLARTYCSWRI